MAILISDKVDFKVLQWSWRPWRMNIRGLLRPVERNLFPPGWKNGIPLATGGVMTF